MRADLISQALMPLGLGFIMFSHGVDLRQAATVGIESSVQNGARAIVIANSIIGNDLMSLPGAIYSLLMYASGIVFVFVMHRLIPTLRPVPVSQTQRGAKVGADGTAISQQ